MIHAFNTMKGIVRIRHCNLKKNMLDHKKVLIGYHCKSGIHFQVESLKITLTVPLIMKCRKGLPIF